MIGRTFDDRQPENGGPNPAFHAMRAEHIGRHCRISPYLDQGGAATRHRGARPAGYPRSDKRLR
jgi:hypothetical protein